MEPRRISLGLTILAALAAPALAQAPPRDFKTRQALDDYYQTQFKEIDLQKMASLAQLAPTLPEDEAESAYSELFNLAVTRDHFAQADQAAAAYLKTGKGSSQTQALGHFVQIMAAADRNETARSISLLDEFLQSSSATKKGQGANPTLIFAVGEAFLQKLVASKDYDDAKKACGLFVKDSTDPQIKQHFAGRMKRLEMLGQPAPELAGKDADGKPVALKDYRGKVVLVDFWATWAPPCVAQMPHYGALQAKYGSKGFQVLGVNVDSSGGDKSQGGPASDQVVRQFLIGMQIDWPTIVNTPGANDLAKVFNVTDLPANFLISRDGKIIQIELNESDWDKSIESALNGTRKE